MALDQGPMWPWCLCVNLPGPSSASRWAESPKPSSSPPPSPSWQTWGWSPLPVAGSTAQELGLESLEVKKRSLSRLDLAKLSPYLEGYSLPPICQMNEDLKGIASCSLVAPVFQPPDSIPTILSRSGRDGIPPTRWVRRLHNGHTSPTWLTCGVIEAKLRSLSRCLSKKLDTPIARTLPCSYNSSRVRHALSIYKNKKVLLLVFANHWLVGDFHLILPRTRPVQ